MKDCYIKGMYETCIHAEKCSKTTYSMNNDICQGCKAYAQKLPINGTKYTPSRTANPGRMEDNMADKLYKCCNTCAHKDDSFYGCSKASECYNGFSAYSPNSDMQKQEEAKEVTQ